MSVSATGPAVGASHAAARTTAFVSARPSKAAHGAASPVSAQSVSAQSAFMQAKPASKPSAPSATPTQNGQQLDVRL